MEKEFLEEHLAAGLSLRQIGELCGRTPSTVGYWVKRHGLTANGSSKFRPGSGVAREPLATMVANGMRLAEIAEELQVGVSAVRYWIVKHGLPPTSETRRDSRAARLVAGPTRRMSECESHGMTEFRLDGTGTWRCRFCSQGAVTKRRRLVKRVLVEEAGGKCVICGYDRFVGALQFHHLDPAAKRFSLSQKGHTVGIERAREEAGKCALLCANCHAEVEAGVAEIPPERGDPDPASTGC